MREQGVLAWGKIKSGVIIILSQNLAGCFKYILNLWRPSWVPEEVTRPMSQVNRKLSHKRRTIIESFQSTSPGDGKNTSRMGTSFSITEAENQRLD